MQGFNWGGFFGYLGNLYLFEGALTTIWLTAVSITIGLALGFIIALNAAVAPVAAAHAGAVLHLAFSRHARCSCSSSSSTPACRNSASG